MSVSHYLLHSKLEKPDPLLWDAKIGRHRTYRTITKPDGVCVAEWSWYETFTTIGAANGRYDTLEQQFGAEWSGSIFDITALISHLRRGCDSERGQKRVADFVEQVMLGADVCAPPGA